MEKIGVSFRVPNTYGKLLYVLLNNILKFPYTWRKGSHIEILFTDNFDHELEYIDGLEVLNSSQMKNYVTYGDYYPIFATFYGYLSADDIGKPISNGADFINSDCNILICIVDSVEVIFLSKDPSIIDDIEKKYFQHHFSNLKHIDTEDCLSLRFD